MSSDETEFDICEMEFEMSFETEEMLFEISFEILFMEELRLSTTFFSGYPSKYVSNPLAPFDLNIINTTAPTTKITMIMNTIPPIAPSPADWSVC